MTLSFVKLLLTGLLSGALVMTVALALGEALAGGICCAACIAMAFLFPPAAILLALIGVLAVMLAAGRKRSEAGGGRATDDGHGSVRSGTRYSVVCLRGPLAGVARDLSPARPRLELGRDRSRCDLVFPEGTKGVSGHHCSIYLENGSVYLEDDSSYGCFLLETMQRLPKNVPVRLAPGAVILLATDEIALQVNIF